MAAIPDIEIERVKRSVDLVELIAGYGVKLERAGHEFRARCPFHEEMTPSFTITPAKNLYKCFGCDAGGGPIDFVMRWEGVDFRKAVDILGGKIGINVSAPQKAPAKPPADEADEWQMIAAPAAEAAPTSLRVQRGGKWSEYPVVAAWAYRDIDGALLAYDCRIEPQPGKKDIIPVTWQVNTKTGETRWKQGSLPKPRVLYGSELLAANPAKQVILAEGCKTAEAGRRLFGDAAIVMSWMGGAKAVRFSNWQLLTGRKVVIWPDSDLQKDPQSGELLPFPDQAGTRAALNIAKELAAFQVETRIVEVPTVPGEWSDGYDLADVEADGRGADWAFAYLRNHLRTPAEIEATSFKEQEQPPAPSAHEESAPPPADSPPPIDWPTTEDEQPFKILGFDRDRAFYLPHGSKQVIELTASAHTKNNMLVLAPLHYWEQNFPSNRKNSNGIDWDLAINALIQRAQREGIYDRDRVRGRGAWWDEGKWAVHLGDQVIINGEKFSLHDAPTNYIYEKSRPLKIQFEDPLQNADAVKLVQFCERARWTKPISGKLLAGWVFLAPICGALEWRPHLWISGPAGSGKTTVWRHIIGRCLGDIALKAEGETTEAGMRQALVHDARPVICDEFESERKKSAERVEDVLAMVTRASSETGAQLIKGSGEGKSQGFKTRAMFCFSSIGVNIKQFAAATRITVLEMYAEEETADSRKAFDDHLKHLLDTLNPDFIERLQARAIHMIPVIRDNAKIFSEAAAIALKSSRAGDQIGTLLAGVYALHSNKLISREEAYAWITRQNWDDVTEISEGKDEVLCVAHILSYQMRIETSDGQVTRTLGEVIQRGAMFGESQTDFAVNKEECRATVKRFGIRIDGEGDSAFVCFANKHRELQKVLAGTSWESSYWRTLQRIAGAIKIDPSKFGSVTARGVKLPITAIM